VLGIWFHKFYEPKGLENRTKIITVSGKNGLKIKQFLKPEGCDIDEVLHVLSIREVTHVPVSEVLLMMIFVLPKF
jgi:hypothetical protein